MTTDELRAAAERLATRHDKAYWRQTASTDSDPAVDAPPVARAYLSAPSWHARPPVPGQYVYAVPCATWALWAVSQGEVDHFAAWPPVGRWFGPIPANPEDAK